MHPMDWGGATGTLVQLLGVSSRSRPQAGCDPQERIEQFSYVAERESCSHPAETSC